MHMQKFVQKSVRTKMRKSMQKNMNWTLGRSGPRDDRPKAAEHEGPPRVARLDQCLFTAVTGVEPDSGRTQISDSTFAMRWRLLSGVSASTAKRSSTRPYASTSSSLSR